MIIARAVLKGRNGRVIIEKIDSEEWYQVLDEDRKKFRYEYVKVWFDEEEYPVLIVRPKDDPNRTFVCLNQLDDLGILEYYIV